MASTTFAASGDGQVDLGGVVTVTDFIGKLTTPPVTTSPLPGVSPYFFYRLGYFSFGDFNNFTGSNIVYWQPPLYAHNEQFAFDFNGGNATAIQFVRWHLEGGAVFSCKIYY
jgi:hypothetical protein